MTLLRKCVCGRLRYKLHCTLCGGATCYALKSKARTVRDENGDPLRVMTYSCRTCGSEFDDLNKNDCHAPEVQSTKEEKEVNKTMRELSKHGTPELRSALLEGLLEKRPELRSRIEKNKELNESNSETTQAHTNEFEREMEEKINNPPKVSEP